MLKTFVDSIFSPSAFDGAPLVVESALGPALLSPEGTQISNYLGWANGLPDRNPTSWLDLADSAARVVASAQGSSLFLSASPFRLRTDSSTFLRCRSSSAPESQEDGIHRRHGNGLLWNNEGRTRTTSLDVVSPQVLPAVSGSSSQGERDFPPPLRISMLTRKLSLTLQSVAHPTGASSDPIYRCYLREFETAKKLVSRSVCSRFLKLSLTSSFLFSLPQTALHGPARLELPR